MVNTVSDRVAALMLANGQHGCWSVAALPLPSETRGIRGTRVTSRTFSSLGLACVRRGDMALLLAGRGSP